MNVDRKETLSITRSLDKTVVKLTIVENGVNVSYAVKTYESHVAEAVKTARAGAQRILDQVNDG